MSARRHDLVAPAERSYDFSEEFVTLGRQAASTSSAHSAHTAALRPPCPGSRRDRHADVWVEDYRLTSAGPVRRFTTPANLEPDKTYHYAVKARWVVNGDTVTIERMVNITTGQMSVVDFGYLPAAVPTTTAY